jgi:hypothetical protein
MKRGIAILLFCGALPAGCQSLAPAIGLDREIGPPAPAPEFVPMTFSERARYYLLGAFGPGAVARAAAAGAFAQGTVEPREWHEGAAAYGDRVGSAFAQQAVREALEFGGSTVLQEDNRYFRSTESGFFKRTKHVVRSVFLARNDVGSEHFAFSRFGAIVGSSFISRLWLPRSQDGPGDAGVSVGFTVAVDLGWTFVKEFAPSRLTKPFEGRW